MRRKWLNEIVGIGLIGGGIMLAGENLGLWGNEWRQILINYWPVLLILAGLGMVQK